jgi:uncharacterized membrane protein YciS (DUF1049 family)
VKFIIIIIIVVVVVIIAMSLNRVAKEPSPAEFGSVRA